MQNFGFILIIIPFGPCWVVFLPWSFYAGEDIWRFVGKLTDAQKSMLDDRFKWKVRSYLSHFSFLSDLLHYWWRWWILTGPGDGKEKGRKARWSEGDFKAFCQGKWVRLFILDFLLCSCCIIYLLSFYLLIVMWLLNIEHKMQTEIWLSCFWFLC